MKGVGGRVEGSDKEKKKNVFGVKVVMDLMFGLYVKKQKNKVGIGKYM